MRSRLVDQARKRGDRLVVCDIPLLFLERYMTDRFDRIILVDAHRAIRLERLMRDRSLSETEAMEMIAAQMPAELKRARADFVIDNDGTMSQPRLVARKSRCVARRSITRRRRADKKRQAAPDA